MPVDLSLVELAPVQPREAPGSFAYDRYAARGRSDERSHGAGE